MDDQSMAMTHNWRCECGAHNQTTVTIGQKPELRDTGGTCQRCGKYAVVGHVIGEGPVRITTRLAPAEDEWKVGGEASRG